jgi:hypothetical protein
MVFNPDFVAEPWMARSRGEQGRVGCGVTIRKDSAGRTIRPSPRATSSTRGSGSSIRHRPPYAFFLYDIKNGEAYNKKKITTPRRSGSRKDELDLEVTLEGPRGYFPVLAAYLAALPMLSARGGEVRRQVDGARQHRVQRPFVSRLGSKTSR